MSWTARVRLALKAKGYTMQDLAVRIGVKQPAVSLYLSGKREPTISQIKEMAKMLDMSLSELLGDDATFIADKKQIEALEEFKQIPDDKKEIAIKLLRSLQEIN